MLWCGGGALWGGPVITEFMANNAGMVQDEAGASSDWVEIYNPTGTALDLSGWFLSDDRSKLKKWRFPYVILAPGEFLVVWASGKNQRLDGQPLHANFALSSLGGFLGLTEPDGITLAQQFDYPPQLPDRSYGAQFSAVKFVGAGSIARYKVPTKPVGTFWQTPELYDGQWKGGPVGLGYGLRVPGITVRQVQATSDFGPVNSADAASALLSLPAESRQIAKQTTVTAAVVNYLGTGSDGRFGLNQTLPNGTGEPYALEARGEVEIPTSGPYTFGISSDDGGRIRIDGTDVVVDLINHGARDSIGSIYLTAGRHAFEVVMWESGGGDEIEFFAGSGAFTSWQSNFRLVGDTANGGLAASTESQGPGGEWIGTYLGSTMKGQNASCYIRTNFSAQPAAFTTLQLRMRYEDGFVAYLNGTEVAARNAPAELTHYARATAARTPSEAFQQESINLSAWLPLLRAGKNVLAFQGLNASAADESFYLAPELVAGGLLAGAPPVFFEIPTPGAINETAGLLGELGEVVVSVGRGFYSAPIQVALSVPVLDASIRYTVDGSTPSLVHGSLYRGPIPIGATTVLRMAAFRDGYKPSPVGTATYVFPADVITQSPTGTPPLNSPGWPAPNPGEPNINYGMDPAIVKHADPALGGVGPVTDALLALPTVSLVTDLPHLFDASSGIIFNPTRRGLAWERPCSVEMLTPPDALHPQGRSEFQINAGVRVRGGASRSPRNPKHGFHLYFREEYGAKKLEYPLFGRAGVDVFDQIDLRTAQNYSWAYAGDTKNTFLREEASRKAQLEMGQPASHGRFFHLYINGQYWGIFDFDERTEASFAESYLGGEKGNYDVIKAEQDSGYTVGATDGDLAAWQELWIKARAHAAQPTNGGYFKLMGLAADGVTPTADRVLLDVDNLIDYMLLTFWTGNTDGATSSFLGDTRANNWFGIRDRTGRQGFRFFAHDFEHSLGVPSNNPALDRTGPFLSVNQSNFSYSNPMFLHQDLLANAEYRLRWADRIQKHCFEDGALTTAAWVARINGLATVVGSAIMAESARWGDSKVTPARNRSHWVTARDWILNTFLPGRSATVLNQLRADGLYPALAAPTISPFGGSHPAGTEVIFNAPTGVIYLMPDGSDPRAVAGALRPGAQIQPRGSPSPFRLVGSGVQRVRARIYNAANATWSALAEATFLIDTVTAAASNLAISEMMVAPNGPTAAEAAAGFSDPEAFEYLTLTNFSAQAVDLQGLSLEGGVRFHFKDSVLPRTLGAGERLFVVSDRAAFTFRYGSALPIAGSFEGKLENGGDQVVLSGPNGERLRQTDYAPSGLWPELPGEGGYSLVWLEPSAEPGSENLPGNWTLSTGANGNVNGAGSSQVAFQTNTVTFPENEGPGLIRLFRTGSTKAAASVAFSARNGSAVFGNDFTVNSGFVSFAPGQSSATLFLPLRNDTVCEADEALIITLSNPSGAVLGPTSEITVTIENDDDPLNDDFANALGLTGESGSVTGPSFGADLELGEPHHGGPGGRSLWFRWNAPVSGLVTFDTTGSLDAAGAPLDTLLAAYLGSTLTTLSAVAPTEQTPAHAAGRTLSFSVSAGESYAIALDGRLRASGQTVLNWRMTPGSLVQFSAPEFRGEESAGLAVITVRRTGANARAISVAYEVSSGIAGPGHEDAPITGRVEFAAGQVVRSFTIPIADDEVAGGDKWMRLSLGAPSAGAYLYGVTTATLTVTDDEAVPANNAFTNAGWLDGLSGELNSSNRGADLEPGEPSHGGEGGKSIWFRWTAPKDGTVIIDTNGSLTRSAQPLDTLLAVYHGERVDVLNELAANDDVAEGDQTSLLTFSVVAGTTYRIAVDTKAGTAGTIVLHWEFLEGDSLFERTPGLARPRISLRETYEQTLAGSAATGRETVERGSLTMTIVASMRGIPLSSLSKDTAVSLRVGNFIFTDTLGKKPTYENGQASRSFELRRADDQGFVGTVRFVWSAKTLVVVVTSTSAQYLVAAQDYLHQTGSISDQLPAARVELGFAGRTGHRLVYLSGTAKVEQRLLESGPSLETFFLSKVTLTGRTDDLEPRARMVTPVEGERTSLSTIEISGVASDETRLAAVSLQLNGQLVPGLDLQYDALQTSVTWSVPALVLAPGLNEVEVTIEDESGNRTQHRRLITKVMFTAVTLAVEGAGSILPYSSGSFLEIGRRYRLRATPEPGWLFAGWSGSISSSRSALEMMMAEGFTLTARFVPNPFLQAQGRYRGLILAPSFTPAQTGTISLLASRTGAVTAKVQLGSAVFSLGGRFLADGTFHKTITRPGQPSLLVTLRLDLLAQQVVGTVSDGSFVSEVVANLDSFSALTALAPQAGLYTLLFKPPALPSIAGFGYARMTVTGTGWARATGRLNDGTVLSFGSGLSKDGVLPIYRPVEQKRGLLSGTLAFTPNSPAVTGELDWYRSAAFNQFEFSTSLEVEGARYQVPLTGWASSLLDAPNGRITLRLNHPQFSEDVQLLNLAESNSAVLPVGDSAAVGALSLRLDPATGLFRGQFSSPGFSSPRTFSGVISNGLGAGYFLTPTGSGSVQLTASEE